MKNLLYLVAVCMLAASTHLGAQTSQMKNWFIAPKIVEMPPGNSPVVTPMPVINGVAPAQALWVANGIYDDNDNLLFYVSDNNVYDYNNSLIGTIDPPNGGAETVIVPFGNNGLCQSKFNVFTTTANPDGDVSLVQTIVNLKSLSLSSSIVFSMPIQREFGALALGKLTGGVRFLYFLAGSGTILSQSSGMIYKLTVNNNGSVNTPTLVYPITPYANDGAEVYSRELDLSPDGQYLAWASLAPENSSPTQYRYHFLRLDANGNYVNSSYQQFNIPGIAGNNVSGFRGVEFYQSGSATKLFMGTGTDGIYYTDIPNVSGFTNVQNSNGSATSAFGFSQIEHSHNGYMYAASGNSSIGNVGTFDPNAPLPAIIPTALSISLINPLPPNSGYSGAALYTLPDQIDGEDYDQIVPVAIPPLVTASSCTISSGGLVAWTNGSGTSNPWSTSAPVHILQELRISQNTKLTIDNMTFKFSPGARVIIENGSSLTLDNGTIFTSNHDTECNDDYSWFGVEVWGSPTNQSQNPSNPPLVGKLTLKNGSKIENALCGARAQRSEGFVTHRGGIIISESGSMFVNNKMDVQFLPYQNINNGITYGNKSYFINTMFTNDNEFIELFTGAPLHVSIDDNRGIRFTNCHFTNYNSGPMFQRQSIGIKSSNANFSVSGGSTFSNLYRAIDAYRSSGAQTFTVTNSIFTDNEASIYAWNVNKISVHRNTFHIGGHQRNPGGTHFGIRHFNGTGYSIQENDFIVSANSIANEIGINVINSGTAANQIYKNTFSGLNFGNYSNGQNRANHPNGNLQGLQWLCNKNINNTLSNFYVLGSNNNNGVRLFQGTSTYPAGNEFTIPGSSFTHFNNVTPSALSYYYNPTTLQSPLFFNSQVIPISTGSISNSCPSLLCIPACERESLTAQEISQLHNAYDTVETAYLNMLFTYNQLMDGGNTNVLLNEIQLNWSADANTLFNELMELSPYLSQEILRDVAMMDVLPSAMMLTVCMANPDATKEEEFLYFLSTEIPNPLPQYMIDLIISSWDEETARTTLENMLADQNHEMAVISDKILIDTYDKLSLQIDELNPSDSINYGNQLTYWLNRTQNIEAKYELIENLLSSGDTESAEQIIEDIPVDFMLSDEQLTAHQTYVFFYEFRKTLIEADLSFSNLDSNQISQLVSYTVGTFSFAAGMIQNALCFYHDICRDFELEEPGNRLMNQSKAPVSVNLYHLADRFGSVIVSPNPASDNARIRYNGLQATHQTFFIVSDLTGKEIKRVLLPDSSGEIVMDVSAFSKGIHYFHVENDSRKTHRGKISIIR